MTFVFPLDFPHAGSPDAVRSLVGGKAAGLGIMARDLDLPVPPGFVISTEACRMEAAPTAACPMEVCPTEVILR